MKITGKYEGDLVLSEDLESSGIIRGGLVVTNGNHARVTGIVNGHILVEPGGSLILHGTASGGVTNNGGTIDIYGVVKCGLYEVGGITKIHPNARVE